MLVPMLMQLRHVPCVQPPFQVALNASPPQVALCDTSNNFVPSPIGHSCICSVGYFLNQVTSTCDDCSAALSYCLACTSPSHCTSCSLPFTPVSGTCQCLPKQYYDPIQNACIDCFKNCKACSDSTTCLSCDSSIFRSLNGAGCDCNINYEEDAFGNCLATGTCITGLISMEQHADKYVAMDCSLSSTAMTEIFNLATAVPSPAQSKSTSLVVRVRHQPLQNVRMTNH